ncbi:MAG TPA: HAMP domain-containing sensor histidine kinase [Terriglobales bacterium]|nr:HAMP domain-containing sensor histidine kinase [Terriglobales bacterium]
MQPVLAERTGSCFDVQQQELARAFTSFTQAANSLEHSYAQLQSEVVRLRLELDEKNRELSRSQALVEVSAILAHEIRNPLGSLELFVNLLADSDATASPSDRADWISQIQVGVRTLAATVNNVLHVYSSPPASLVTCDLGELLDRAAEFVVPLVAQNRLHLEMSNALHGVTRPADLHRFHQVLLNLVMNALRFTPSGGRISLAGTTQSKAGRRIAEINVSDTGAGIAAEHLDKIFTAGFSTRGSPGLGLAVCKKIVEQHGGTIFAASQPGQGATFTIRLPLS